MSSEESTMQSPQRAPSREGWAEGALSAHRVQEVRSAVSSWLKAGLGLESERERAETILALAEDWLHRAAFVPSNGPTVTCATCGADISRYAPEGDCFKNRECLDCFNARVNGPDRPPGPPTPPNPGIRWHG